MRATRDARANFSRLLSDLRDELGVTQRWIAAEMAKLGHDVSTQTVSGWERGAFAPDRRKTQALDDLLGANGKLLDALGYSSSNDVEDQEARLAALERKFAGLADEIGELRAERSKPNAG